MGKGSPRERAEGQDQRGKQGQITQGIVALSGLAGLSPEGNRELAIGAIWESVMMGTEGRDRQTEYCLYSSCIPGRESPRRAARLCAAHITLTNDSLQSPPRHRPARAHSKLTRKVTQTAVSGQRLWQETLGKE